MTVKRMNRTEIECIQQLVGGSTDKFPGEKRRFLNTVGPDLNTFTKFELNLMCLP